MRKGVIVSRGECGRKNIGDYIQTLAALQFAGEGAELLERETLHDVAGDPVRIVMNAWFMHHPERFPPSKSIVPLFVSFHLTPRVHDSFFTESAVDYLKAHEPIGCRDRETAEVLERHGVRAAFTSCLTLTLGETYRHRRTDSPPVFVDPWLPVPEKFGRLAMIFRLVRRLPYALAHLGVLRRIFARNRAFASYPFASRPWVRWLYTVDFHRAYARVFSDEVLAGADYMTHKVSVKRMPEERDRLACADRLLRRYADAPFVVTSRLHCALPCTAMGTPVLVPYEVGMEKGRFGGNREFLNLLPVNAEGFVTLPATIDVQGRKITRETRLDIRTEHLPYARELARRCRAFMREEASA